MPSIKRCLFHDFPLEVREMIYREAMQEWIDQPIIWRDGYPFTYASSSEIERALIPEKDIYREALAVRLRHSTLILAQPDESKMTREEPLKRHPIEELSLLARHCIRKVTVEVPGRSDYDHNKWTTAKGSSAPTFPIQLISTSLLSALPQFPNLRYLNIAFLTPVITHSKRPRLYRKDFEKTPCSIFQYVLPWLYGFTLLSKEIERLRNLTSFECKAPLFYPCDITPDSEDMRDECDCEPCRKSAVPRQCSDTWNYSWFFWFLDSKFIVDPITYLPEAELSRSSRPREARRKWQCQTAGNLFRTRPGCVDFLAGQGMKKHEEQRARVMLRRDFLLDDKPYVWT